MGSVVHAVTAPVETVTHSIGAAVDSTIHGDIIGAASSLGNAVNPVALANAAYTGTVTNNSSATLASLESDAKKGVQVAANATGMTPQQLTSAGLAVATGGVSALGDVAAGAVTSAITGPSTPVSTANPNIGPRLPAPSQVATYSGGSPNYTPYLLMGGVALVFILILKGRK